MTNRSILVTGGAGFIGANLVRLLLDEGYRGRVLDNFSSGRREYLNGLALEVIEGSILSPKTVARAVAGVDGVVHLATGVETTILELAAQVQKVVGRNIGVQYGPPRRGDIRKNYSAIAKVRRMLDWYPRIELEEGLRQVWTWFNAQVGDVR